MKIEIEKRENNELQLKLQSLISVSLIIFRMPSQGYQLQEWKGKSFREMHWIQEIPELKTNLRKILSISSFIIDGKNTYFHFKYFFAIAFDINIYLTCFSFCLHLNIKTIFVIRWKLNTGFDVFVKLFQLALKL